MTINRLKNLDKVYLRTYSFYTLFNRLCICFLCWRNLKICKDGRQQDIKMIAGHLVIGCRESVEQRPILLHSGEALEKKIESTRLPDASHSLDRH